MVSARAKFFIGFWIFYLLFNVVYFYFDKKDLYSNSEKVSATVIDRLEGRGRRGKIYFYPQYQFVYNDSNYISADNNSFVRRKRVGSKLTVIFPKEKPEESTAYTFISYWIVLPSLLIIFMIFILVFAVLLFMTAGKNILYTERRSGQ